MLNVVLTPGYYYLGESLRQAGLRVVEAKVALFRDGEIDAYIDPAEFDNRFSSVILHHSSHDVLSLLILCDAVKRLGFSRIYAIVPYLPYCRQDRVTVLGGAISAKVVADVISGCGISALWSIDIHSMQIQGFYDMPMTNVSPLQLMADDIKSKYTGHDIAVVAPDAGGALRARAIGTALDAPIVMIDKYRERAGVSSALRLWGDVKSRFCIIVDDIIDGGGTMLNAVGLLKDGGAIGVSAYITHPIMSGDAQERISNSDITELVVTNSIHRKIVASNIRTINIDGLISDIVLSIANMA